MKELDLMRLPSEAWQRRAVLLLHESEARVAYGVEFLRDRYENRARLEDCRTFIFTDLFDAPRSDWDSLARVWFFPWIEIQNELSEALNHALLTSYKATYDTCRRALELAVVATYFGQKHVAETAGKEWLRAERETPLFTRALPELLKNPTFRDVDRAASWSEELKGFYWRLCDIVHVRGEKSGFEKLQPSSLRATDTFLREYSAASLQAAAGVWIETARHIATIVALGNPVLLVGFDMSAKFGFNPPLSGFFEDGQSERLRGLLLESVAPHLLARIERDDEVRSVRAWIDGRPDISAEEFAEQAKEQQEFFQTMRTPRSDGA